MQHEFDGGVFSKAIEGGRAGARVHFEADAVVAVTTEGQTYRLPFRACQLELGGASGRMWFCRSAEPEPLTIFSEAHGFQAALFEAGRRELGEQLDQVLHKVRDASRRSTKLWLGALLGAVLALGLLYWGIKGASQASVAVLPHSVDEQIGELAIEHMDVGGTLVTDPVLKNAVDAIMKRLTPPQAGFKFAPRVVDASTVNAFALPGGSMVLYTGLLRAAKTPEQVAGVLAHEMAHVTRRHGMKRIAQSLGIVAGIQLMFGDVSGVAAIAVEVLQHGAVNRYSREQEHEADMDAVQTLARAHVDPKALAEFFVLLEKREGNLPSFVSWLGTHPDLAERIRDVRAAAEKRGKIASEPLLSNWAEVQKHAGAVVGE